MSRLSEYRQQVLYHHFLMICVTHSESPRPRLAIYQATIKHQLIVCYLHSVVNQCV